MHQSTQVSVMCSGINNRLTESGAWPNSYTYYHAFKLDFLTISSLNIFSIYIARLDSEAVSHAWAEVLSLSLLILSQIQVKQQFLGASVSS